MKNDGTACREAFAARRRREREFIEDAGERPDDDELAERMRPSDAELLDDNHAHADKVLEEISRQEAQTAKVRVAARMNRLAEAHEFIRLAMEDGWFGHDCELVWFA